MSLARWFRIPKIRRGLAVSSIALAMGGLVLAKSSASARTGVAVSVGSHADGAGSVSFSGAGMHGTIALSHTRVLAGGERRIFADIDLYADASAQAKDRAPISMAVVLDTSGSMGGEKIDQAKRSVIQLLRDMRDDDEIAFVRYSSDSELVQPLARIGDVREKLIAKVQALQAGGGTNIPPALQAGLAQLAEVKTGNVRRIVLASDGLDGTRAASEAIAKTASARGVTVSSMGIGLDFDEGYMGSIALAGHGNFGFVKDAGSLATFLNRELKETASTVVENATARLELPKGVRFVRAHGGDVVSTADTTKLDLSMGALFAGDHRRVVLELDASLEAGDIEQIASQVSWARVGGEKTSATLAKLELGGTSDAHAVEESRNVDVIADATSVVASYRQIAAAEAYNHGEQEKAVALIAQNQADLSAVQAFAPPRARAGLEAQATAYDGTMRAFKTKAPSSDEGKAAAKGAAAKDMDNLARKAY